MGHRSRPAGLTKSLRIFESPIAQLAAPTSGAATPAGAKQPLGCFDSSRPYYRYLVISQNETSASPKMLSFHWAFFYTLYSGKAKVNRYDYPNLDISQLILLTRGHTRAAIILLLPLIAN